MICPVAAAVSHPVIALGTVHMFAKLLAFLKSHKPTNVMEDVKALVKLLTPVERAQLMHVLAELQMIEAGIAAVEKGIAQVEAAINPIVAAAAGVDLPQDKP